MSEYQYYEFQALDRSLTGLEQSQLRKISSRAEITHNSLTNTYHFGDFKGDPWKLMEKYFDAFLYMANWGTHQFMLRIPAALLSPDVLSSYASDDQYGCFSFRRSESTLVICFDSNDEEGEYWDDDDGHMPSLIPVREELMLGDLRCLYLGWLLRLQAGELRDNQMEPVVPPGLKNLSPPLKNLAEFLRIDQSLLRVAAIVSPELNKAVNYSDDIKAKIQEISESKKDRWLLKLLEGKEPYFRFEILRHLKRHSESEKSPKSKRRVVSELLMEQTRFK